MVARVQLILISILNFRNNFFARERNAVRLYVRPLLDRSKIFFLPSVADTSSFAKRCVPTALRCTSHPGEGTPRPHREDLVQFVPPLIPPCPECHDTVGGNQGLFCNYSVSDKIWRHRARICAKESDPMRDSSCGFSDCYD